MNSNRTFLGAFFGNHVFVKNRQFINSPIHPRPYQIGKGELK